MPTAINDIAHVIQLVIAPVFMLTAIGTVINVLAGRLGRSVDRRRVLVAALPKLDITVADIAQREVAFEIRRIQLIYIAISMSVMSGIFVCLLIALAFIDAFITLNLSKLIAALFILAMLALIGSLLTFLREIFLSTNSPRAPVV
jgi:Protein of unknown function (DUF2721)